MSIMASACEWAPGAATTPVAIEEVDVAYDKASSAYKVTWTSNPPGAPVRVEVSTDPDTGPGAGLVIAEEVTEGALIWPTAGEPARRYFSITPEEGASVTAALRVLPLEGGRNFRDLGGYKTTDGRRVKWGRLYRSGSMAYLTANDYDYLSSLGVSVICDFRSRDERASGPTNWAAGDIDFVTWDYSFEEALAPLRGLFALDVVTEESARDVMRALVSDLPTLHADKYAKMFDRLAAGDAPLAFHCSAGKDRTGAAAALLLTVLGVPRETIYEDYLLSNSLIDHKAIFPQDEKSGSDHAAGEDASDPRALFEALPPEVSQALANVDQSYLEAMFAEMEAKHGSVAAFITEELEVTEAEKAAIREAFLTGP